MMKAKHFSILLALFVFGTSFYILSQTSSTLIHSQSRSLFVSIRNYSSQVLAAKSPLLSNVKFPNNYAEKYEDLLSCVTNTTPSWQSVKDYRMRDYNYSKAAANETHEARITRAVLVYFPVDRVDEYKYEFKWLYRSWLNMMSYEPAKWRTDLVVFIYNESQLFLNRTDFFLTQLNCSFENLRRSSDDPPMCTLLSYTPLRMRNFTARHPPSKFKSSGERYRHILYETDIFSAFSSDFLEFYHLIHSSLEKYSYTDSIMMAFEGYEYAKQAGFSYLVRSDMDVFLTPLFGLWLPRHCNDFNVGRGGYSTDFNTKRFARIARNLRLDYAGVENLGSTWYSTPQQFRLVSYLTLFGMAYLAQEEFTQVEREGKLGVALWPDWHYGVLLLYGQHLALNHLIANKQINVVKLEDQLDFPSGNRRSVMLMLHIHVFHGDNLFSKFAFKMGKYDNKTVNDTTLLGQVKYYALQMALDGKRLSPQNLTNMLDAQIHSKH